MIWDNAALTAAAHHDVAALLASHHKAKPFKRPHNLRSGQPGEFRHAQLRMSLPAGEREYSLEILPGKDS